MHMGRIAGGHQRIVHKTDPNLSDRDSCIMPLRGRWRTAITARVPLTLCNTKKNDFEVQVDSSGTSVVAMPVIVIKSRQIAT